MWTMSSPKGVQKQSHSCSCQGCKARSHTGTLLNLPKHWNPPPSGSCLRNLHQHTLEPSGTFRKLPLEPTWNPPEPSGSCLRNVPEIASGSYTSTHWNPPEPCGSCLQNLHQHTLEPSGTFRKLPLEPTWNPPEPSGSCLRNLPEPSGSCLRKLHQHTLEPSGTFRKLPPEPTPAHTGTLRNVPEVASGTYMEPSGTFRKLPPEPTPAHTKTLRNVPEVASGTYMEPSGTFRKLPPESTPAHAGTLRNLLEPSSGTCSSDPHRHTPELIWAEDPISLRCWGKTPRTEVPKFEPDCLLNKKNSSESPDAPLQSHGPRPASPFLMHQWG